MKEALVTGFFVAHCRTIIHVLMLMRAIFVNEQGIFRKGAFTLLELLVTMTVMAALISLILPAWNSVKRSRARQAALTITMESLERARTAAITGKKEVWVLLRHGNTPSGRTPESESGDAIRIIGKTGDDISPIDPWQPLPAGTSFVPTPGTLMEEAPPREILTSALGGKAPVNTTFGSIMFLRSGRVGIPKTGGNGLSLRIGESATGSKSAPHTACLLISRASGRASPE